MFFYFLVLYLHLLSAVILVGGNGFLVLAFSPVFKKFSENKEISNFAIEVSRKAKFFSRRALELLVLTGIYLFFQAGKLTNFSFSAHFLETITIKIILVAAVIYLHLLISFYHIPKLEKVLQESEGTGESWKKLRSFSALQFILGIVIIFLGLSLFKRI